MVPEVSQQRSFQHGQQANLASKIHLKIKQFVFFFISDDASTDCRRCYEGVRIKTHLLFCSCLPHIYTFTRKTYHIYHTLYQLRYDHAQAHIPICTVYSDKMEHIQYSGDLHENYLRPTKKFKNLHCIRDNLEKN